MITRCLIDLDMMLYYVIKLKLCEIFVDTL
jgi:hypothetical protein